MKKQQEGKTTPLMTLMGGGRGKWRSLVVLLTSILLVFAFLAGCSKGNDVKSTDVSKETAAIATATTAPEKAVKDVVELKAFFPGDAPQGFDEVLAAVNEKLKKDNIGASLKFQFVPWNDYGNLTNVKVASGEEFDMFLDAPWLHINQMIAAGSIIPLDDYVAKSPELLKSIPQEMWNANKFNGKIMGVPLGTTQGNIDGFLIRKDLRVKYGMSELKTFDDVEKFFYTVKEKEKDIQPFVVDGKYGDHSYRFSKTYYTNDFDAKYTYVNYYVDSDKKLRGVWENKALIEGWKKATQFYKDGILEKNIAQQQNAVTLFNQGKYAATQYMADGVEGLKFIDALKIPGVQLEVVIPASNDWKIDSTFQQWNFLCIPKTSKHPDRVMDFMNWLSIKENHDLLAYGIQDKDWKPVGDSQFTQLSKYSFPGYVVSWRPTLIRTPDKMLPDDKKWFEFAKDASNFRTALTTGFVPNLEPVKTEVAKIDPLGEQIGKPMGNGVLEADKGIPMLRDQTIKAGGSKVVEELQHQLDDFFAKKN